MMTQATPKISVCIPTYNYARYLPQAIESVLAQSFNDFELIIIDDCSRDESAEIIRRYQSRDSRIRFRLNPSNMGMVENWNACLREAKGEYIKYLFADDLLSSREAMSKMVKILESNPSVALVSSARTLIDENSRPLRTLSHFGGCSSLGGKEVINRCLYLQKNLIGEPSVVMFRKASATRGFLWNYRQIMDLEMWFHILEKGDFAYIDEPLSCFRVHKEQRSALNMQRVESLDDISLLLGDYMEKPYIRFGNLFKSYLRYDCVYEIWKSYRKKKIIGRAAAIERIDSKYDITKFFLLLPLYKICKPCLRLLRHFGTGKIGSDRNFVEGGWS